jgi:hypothetical protein
LTNRAVQEIETEGLCQAGAAEFSGRAPAAGIDHRGYLQIHCSINSRAVFARPPAAEQMETLAAIWAAGSRA